MCPGVEMRGLPWPSHHHLVCVETLTLPDLRTTRELHSCAAPECGRARPTASPSCSARWRRLGRPAHARCCRCERPSSVPPQAAPLRCARCGMRILDSKSAREDTESAVFGPYSAAFTVLAALGFTRFSEDSAEYRLSAPMLAYSARRPRPRPGSLWHDGLRRAQGNRRGGGAARTQARLHHVTSRRSLAPSAARRSLGLSSSLGLLAL